MKKPGTEWISKQLTDELSRQPYGTLHRYNYFEDEDGMWIYNISFHTEDGCFGNMQLKEPVCIPIEEAIEKTREKFFVAKHIPQPYWSD